MDIEKELKTIMRREQIIMECLKMMHSSEETEESINNALEILGNYLYSDRTYIFSIYGKNVNNAYEWCAEDISKEIESIQQVPLAVIERWMPSFYKDEGIIIQDVEEIKETAPQEYALLQQQNIEQLIVVPLMEKEKLVGYVGVDNPKSAEVEEVYTILKMLAYFFQSLLERKRREDYLQRIGFTDDMTGALNKNAFIRDTMLGNAEGLSSAGGFFVDINGLKQTNDTYGHEAGDRLILQAYLVIRYVVGDFPIYRLGGDEFAVLCKNISRQKMEELRQRMHEELDGRNGCHAAVGSCFLENPGDLGAVITEADKRMYRDKKAYYKKTGGRR